MVSLVREREVRIAHKIVVASPTERDHQGDLGVTNQCGLT
jgi:hypothetical protein